MQCHEEALYTRWACNPLDHGVIKTGYIGVGNSFFFVGRGLYCSVDQKAPQFASVGEHWQGAVIITSLANTTNFGTKKTMNEYWYINWISLRVNMLSNKLGPLWFIKLSNSSQFNKRINIWVWGSELIHFAMQTSSYIVLVLENITQRSVLSVSI